MKNHVYSIYTIYMCISCTYIHANIHTRYWCVCACVCIFTHFFSFLVFLGLHLWHMEVPRLRVESELQLLAYTTATAIQDLSHICNTTVHRNAWILNSLSEARDWTPSSWIPVRFISTEPWQELPNLVFWLSHHQCATWYKEEEYRRGNGDVVGVGCQGMYVLWVLEGRDGPTHFSVPQCLAPSRQ